MKTLREMLKPRESVYSDTAREDVLNLFDYAEGTIDAEKFFAENFRTQGMNMLFDTAFIPTAIRNWMGLQPEERWWLYTMTNASTGGINDKKGWRTALRYALCENPVNESDQITIDQLVGGSMQ